MPGTSSVILIFCEIYIPLTTSQCVSPYVGDGNFCVLDSDADSYPDLKLKTCEDTDTETYCSADTCPNAPNPDQSDTTPCIGDATGNNTFTLLPWGDLIAILLCGIRDFTQLTR